MELSGDQLVFAQNGNPFNDERKYALVNWLNIYNEDLKKLGIIVEQSIVDRKFYTGNQNLDLSIQFEN